MAENIEVDKKTGYKWEAVKKTPLVEVKKNKPDLRKTEPPMVDIKVSNPLTYIKSWWKKIIGNEGMEVRIIIKPLTAIAVAIVVLTVTLGIGRFVLPFKIPFFEYTTNATPTPTPTPTFQPIRETAFIGELKVTKDKTKYYLFTAESEAITLNITKNINLEKFTGERILAIGTFNQSSRVLTITDPKKLEVLPEKPVTIPTPTPTPTPTTTPNLQPKDSTTSATN